MAPVTKKPRIIAIHVAGSGTGETGPVGEVPVVDPVAPVPLPDDVPLPLGDAPMPPTGTTSDGAPGTLPPPVKGVIGNVLPTGSPAGCVVSDGTSVGIFDANEPTGSPITGAPGGRDRTLDSTCSVSPGPFGAFAFFVCVKAPPARAPGERADSRLRGSITPGAAANPCSLMAKTHSPAMAAIAKAGFRHFFATPAVLTIATPLGRPATETLPFCASTNAKRYCFVS